MISDATMKTRPVSLIVLSWNGLEVTRNCISSILERTTHPDYEVIAVDNMSTDGTREYLHSVEGITVIDNPENLGFVKGNNIGIGSVDTDVLLLNNDTEIIQPDWLERIQQVAYSADDIGIVGCRLVNAEGNLVHAGTYMPLPSFWGQEYPGDEKDIGQYTDDSEVEAVIFACAYIKRELIDRVGALDTDYFSYYEDTDYCNKAREAGYRVFRCGGATVMHLENASTDVNRMDFSGTFRRSRETFLEKWKEKIEARYTRKLTWHSFISCEDEYSRISSNMLWALDRAGVDLNLGFLEGADKAELDDFRINDMKNRGRDRNRRQVLFGPPPMLSMADGAGNIGYLFTPYDRFVPEWVKEINRLDEVWVPDEFQAEAARASGVTRDIHVIPFGMDVDHYNPRINANRLEGRFLFLSVMDWGEPVAWRALLEAFTAEFSGNDKVVLVLKVTSPEPGAQVEEDVEGAGLPFERAPIVFVVDHDIPEYQYASLYRSSDCVIFADRTAAPAARASEALASGTPVIVPRWGSFSCLVDGIASKGFECTSVPAPVDGVRWAEPDSGSMRAVMRAAFDGAVEAKEAAMKLSEVVRREQGSDTVAARMIERLDAQR